MDTDPKPTIADQRAASAKVAAEESLGGSKPEGFAAHKDAIQNALANLLSLKVDLYRAKARRLVFTLSAVAVGFVVAVTMLVTATALLIQGVAGGIGHWAGDRMWLGQILAPMLLLGTVLLAAWLVSKRAASKRLRALAEKYPLDNGVRPTVPVQEGTNGRHNGN